MIFSIVSCFGITKVIFQTITNCQVNSKQVQTSLQHPSLSLINWKEPIKFCICVSSSESCCGGSFPRVSPITSSRETRLKTKIPINLTSAYIPKCIN